MKVLIGCEESGKVTQAFRKAGCDAFSCDLLPTRGNPDWHYQADIMEIIGSRSWWDLIILHPDCSKLSLSGNRWYGFNMPKHQERLDAIYWTRALWQAAKCRSSKVCLENPTSVIFKYLDAAVQYINPYQFGHMEQKKTGLALYGLAALEETNNVYSEMMKLPKKERERVFHMPPGPNRKRDRSETYSGIASAMAEQWT